VDSLRPHREVPAPREDAPLSAFLLLACVSSARAGADQEAYVAPANIRAVDQPNGDRVSFEVQAERPLGSSSAAARAAPWCKLASPTGGPTVSEPCEEGATPADARAPAAGSPRHFATQRLGPPLFPDFVALNPVEQQWGPAVPTLNATGGDTTTG
jgi:hypothetical protein